jgi:hypothetical protein
MPDYWICDIHGEHGDGEFRCPVCCYWDDVIQQADDIMKLIDDRRIIV